MELTLVGTGHVFAIGPRIEAIIAERRPDLVCVELDPLRLRGLQERRRLHQLEAAGDPRADEIKEAHRRAVKRLPIMYRFMARTQERLATHEGVEAGSEMLAAVDAAQAQGIPLATIDVDAQRLVQRAWSEMRFLERLRFIWAMARGGAVKDMEDQMQDYQADPVAYLAKVGDEFPTLKRVLIDERDAHMARQILGANEQRHRLPGSPETLRVVAVVGDGHVGGMLDILRARLADDEVEVIRVGDLREGQLPASPFPERAGPPEAIVDDDGGNTARYSVEVHDDVPPPERD